MSVTFGHIKLSRKLFDSDAWWTEKRVFSRFEAWVDMLQLAAWKPVAIEYHGESIRLSRGELILSIRLAARRWSWTPKQARGFLKRAQDRAQVRAQRESLAGTVYLIVNYDTYQSSREPKGTPEGTPKGIEGAQQGHTQGTARAQEEAFFSLPVQRFLAALPDGKRPAWEASISNWTKGLGFPGGRCAHPDDIDVGLTEYLSDNDAPSFNPNHVKAYVVKAETSRTQSKRADTGGLFSPSDVARYVD